MAILPRKTRDNKFKSAQPAKSQEWKDALDTIDGIADVAALLADTTEYTDGTTDGWTAGEYLRTKAGFVYKVAASGASDHHLTTAGSVKLYIVGAWTPMHFGAVGDGTTDDTDAWSDMFDAINASDDFWSVFGEAPYCIDLHNKTFVLANEVLEVNKNLKLANGKILSNKATIVLGGRIDDNTAAICHGVDNLNIKYTGTGYYARGLLEIPAAFSTTISRCYMTIGDGASANRARYGLYVGETRCWGVSLIGGRYRGGDIAIRIGHNEDHTGSSISGGLTAAHSRYANILACNPAGLSIHGCNIEHSDMNGVGLAITSQTNGVSSDNAHSISIRGCYFFNNGNGTGSGDSPASIQIGYDVVGTDDFDDDAPVDVITSATNATGITIENNYLVSTQQQRAIKVAALTAVTIKNNVWGTDDNSIGFTFSSTCGKTYLESNRNQNTGTFDLYDSTATNTILTSRTGSYTPAILGSTSNGTHTYSGRSGRYVISGDMCTVSGHIIVSATSVAPVGNIRISLPFACQSDMRSVATVHSIGITDTGATNEGIAGVIFGGDDFIALKWDGETTNVVAGEIGSTPTLYFSATYRVDLKTS